MRARVRRRKCFAERLPDVAQPPHLFEIADETILLQPDTYFASSSANRGSPGFTTVAVSSAALSSALRVVNSRGVLHVKSVYSPIPRSAANRDSSPKR